MLDNPATALDTLELLQIAKDIASGCLFLHTMRKTPMPHGNLKASAVLITERMTAKVAWRGTTKDQPWCFGYGKSG